MRRSISTLVFAAATALANAPTFAVSVGTPVTYSNLVWFVSLNAPGLTICNQLVIDATGDVVNSDGLLLYGAMNCNPGAYGVTGSAFVASDGTLHITMLLAGYTVSCPRVAGYAGACTVYDADWVTRGTGRIELL